MKTKTTEDILNDCNKFLEIPPKKEGASIVFPNPFNFLQEKWVRVDDVLESLADLELEIHSKQIISPVIMSKLLKKYFDELSQSVEVTKE